jgi:AmmeMemoRadiSam system protein A
MLTQEERRGLLQIARDAIESVILNRLPGRGPVLSEGLLSNRGAFVTIRVDGQLHGCIGYIESEKPLAQVVEEVAGKAAFEDPRFPPLTLADYRRSTIEISILSGLTRVTSPEEIEIGRDGLVLESHGHRGLLLPQVAVEQGWDREAFLQGVARKAGLLRMSWNDPDGNLYKFTVEVVREEGSEIHV